MSATRCGRDGSLSGMRFDALERDSVPLRDLRLFAIPVPILLLASQIDDGPELVPTDARIELLRRELTAAVYAIRE